MSDLRTKCEEAYDKIDSPASRCEHEDEYVTMCGDCSVDVIEQLVLEVLAEREDEIERLSHDNALLRGDYGDIDMENDRLRAALMKIVEACDDIPDKWIVRLARSALRDEE